MRVYLAGPPDADGYRAKASALLLDRAITAVDPMRRDFRGRTVGRETEIVEGDLLDIDSCDAVLADFSEPDEGTSMEAWYAHSTGTPVIVHTAGRTPHPWTIYTARSVHAKLEDAIDALNEVLKAAAVTRKVKAPARIFVPARGTTDWRALLGNPMTQWRIGYSARALAESWQSAMDVPDAVRRVFRSSPHRIFQKLELLLAIPEHRVALPGGAASSQTDLFAVARSQDDGLVAIAVEGKAEEPFDATVADWLERRAIDEERRGRARVPSAGAQARLRHLCQLLEVEEGQIGALYYQLLHRTASALLEARRFGAANALMLVHSFSPTHRWHEDYAAFARCLGAESADVDTIADVGERSNVRLYLGWISDRTTARALEDATPPA
jgi:nucleoside 2-deoxyribosyltransferase